MTELQELLHKYVPQMDVVDIIVDYKKHFEVFDQVEKERVEEEIVKKIKIIRERSEIEFYRNINHNFHKYLR